MSAKLSEFAKAELELLNVIYTNSYSNLDPSLLAEQEDIKIRMQQLLATNAEIQSIFLQGTVSYEPAKDITDETLHALRQLVADSIALDALIPDNVKSSPAAAPIKPGVAASSVPQGATSSAGATGKKGPVTFSLGSPVVAKSAAAPTMPPTAKGKAVASVHGSTVVPSVTATGSSNLSLGDPGTLLPLADQERLTQIVNTNIGALLDIYVTHASEIATFASDADTSPEDKDNVKKLGDFFRSCKTLLEECQLKGDYTILEKQQDVIEGLVAATRTLRDIYQKLGLESIAPFVIGPASDPQQQEKERYLEMAKNLESKLLMGKILKKIEEDPSLAQKVIGKDTIPQDSLVTDGIKQILNEISNPDGNVAAKKPLIIAELFANDPTSDDRKFIRSAALELGIVSRTLEDLGISDSGDLALYNNNELCQKFLANPGVPKELKDKFKQKLLQVMSSPKPDDPSLNELKVFLNNCLKYPIWNKPDPVLTRLAELISNKGLEAAIGEEMERINNVFTKKGLIGQGIDQIQDMTKQYLMREMYTISQYLDSHGSIDGYTPRPFPPIVLDGPPGTGKTSIAEVIADALMMGYEQYPLGGAKDTNVVLGMGEEWKAPTPGMLTKAMLSSGGTRNLLLLDEAEKAELDVLNALGNYLEPNAAMQKDNYFNCMLPAWGNFFVLTTNKYDELPEHIKSRVTKVDLLGYSKEDKLKIIKSKVSKDVLMNKVAEFSPEAMKEFIENYSDEPGCRELFAMYQDILGYALAKKPPSGKIIINAAFIKEALAFKGKEPLHPLQKQMVTLRDNYVKAKEECDKYENEIKTLTNEKKNTKDASAQEEIEHAIAMAEMELKHQQRVVIRNGESLLPVYNQILNTKHSRITKAYKDDIKESIDDLQLSLAISRRDAYKDQPDSLEFLVSDKIINKYKKRKIKRMLASIEGKKLTIKDSLKNSSNIGKFLEELEREKEQGLKDLEQLIRDGRITKIRVGLLREELHRVKIKSVNKRDIYNKDSEIDDTANYHSMIKEIFLKIQKNEKDIKDVKPDAQQKLEQENVTLKEIAKQVFSHINYQETYGDVRSLSSEDKKEKQRLDKMLKTLGIDPNDPQSYTHTSRGTKLSQSSQAQDFTARSATLMRDVENLANPGPGNPGQQRSSFQLVATAMDGPSASEGMSKKHTATQLAQAKQELADLGLSTDYLKYLEVRSKNQNAVREDQLFGGLDKRAEKPRDNIKGIDHIIKQLSGGTGIKAGVKGLKMLSAHPEISKIFAVESKLSPEQQKIQVIDKLRLEDRYGIKTTSDGGTRIANEHHDEAFTVDDPDDVPMPDKDAQRIKKVDEAIKEISGIKKEIYGNTKAEKMPGNQIKLIIPSSKTPDSPAVCTVNADKNKITMQTESDPDHLDLDSIHKMVTMMIDACKTKGLNVMVVRDLYDQQGRPICFDEEKTKQVVKIIKNSCTVSGLNYRIDNQPQPSSSAKYR